MRPEPQALQFFFEYILPNPIILTVFFFGELEFKKFRLLKAATGKKRCRRISVGDDSNR